MTAPAGSEVPVEAPRLEEPKVGVLAQVPRITGADADRWLTGMILSPEAQGRPEFDQVCSTDVLPQDFNRWVNTTVHPFIVRAHDRCSTFGFTEANYVERVSRALAVKRHWGVDREWEKGEEIPGNRRLAATYAVSRGPATVQLAAGANVSPSDALALLDEGIGNSANAIGRGMIWATPFVAAKWAAAGMLSDMETVDGRTEILSPAGNYVIIGNGFEGRGPDGTVPAAHASQWAYATDPVAVVEGSAETFPGSFDEARRHDHNQVIYRQEQPFAILWSGLLHAAVKVATATPTVA